METKSSADSEYSVGKYLFILIKGSSKPVSGKIIEVIFSDSGTIVKLENNATFMFGEQHNSNYVHIETYSSEESKPKLNTSMNESPQKIFVIALVLCILINDILYIAAWSMNELNTLSDSISCGILNLYDDSNGNAVSYKQICDEYGECNMQNQSNAIIVCTIIAFILENTVVLYCILMNVRNGPHINNSKYLKASLFIGFVMAAIILMSSLSLWDGKGASNRKCSDGCLYLDTECTKNDKGVTQIIFIVIECLSIVYGVIFTLALHLIAT